MLIISACRQNDQIKVGLYKAVDENYVEKLYRHYFQKVQHFGKGELAIKSDSTFSITTCSDITTGKWNFNNNLLFLSVETSRWASNREDSLTVRPDYDYEKWKVNSKKTWTCQLKGDRIDAIATYYNGTKILFRFKFDKP